MKSVSFLQKVLILSSTLLMLACGGGSSDTIVEISGTITYDLVPHTNLGALNYDAIIVEPVKGATVQLISSEGAVIESTASDEAGRYAFEAESNISFRVRVRAELLQTEFPSWRIRVTDNTAENALYVLDGGLSSSGNSDSVRNLHAGSGWTGSDYTQERSAAPFAILDSVYQVLDELVDAQLSQNLPATELRWSESNRVSNDLSLGSGDLPTSFYSPSLKAIYLLGEVNASLGDSDEYDRSVVQHEFGHYLEDVLSRSDSPGGNHSPSHLLDLRLAFSEGFANALTGIVTGTGVYQDSFTRSSLLRGFNVNLETVNTSSLGWYSEGAVGYIIQDIADDDSELGDQLDLGLGPVISALSSSAYTNNVSATSIYTFLDALKNLTNSSTDLAIDTLAAELGIFGEGPLGEGETNDGGFSYVLPVFNRLVLGSSVNVCSGGFDSSLPPFQASTSLQVRRFIQFDIPSSGVYTIAIEKSAVGTGDKNPQANLYRTGQFLESSNGDTLFRSDQVNSEEETIILNQGTYLLVVYEEGNLVSGGSTVCFDVSLTEA